jgi:flagellar biosynthesis component FlhA
MSRAASVPRVDVLLELDPDSVAFAEQAEDAAFRRRTSLALLDLVDALGIPADPIVGVTRRKSTRAVRLSIRGHRVPYPPELLMRAWLAVAPSRLASVPLEPPAENFDFPDNWLAHITEGRRALPLWSAFLERVVVGIAAERPSLFFGDPQARAYAKATGIGFGETRLLRTLLDEGISLVDHQRVREALTDAAGAPPTEAAELVRARLVRHRIEVHAAQSYLEELAQLVDVGVEGSRESAVTRVQGALVRGGWSFADDLGIELPAIEVRGHRHARRREIRFVVNGKAGLPVRGQRRGELLVGATTSQLADLDVEVRAAWNPAWDQVGAIVRDADRTAVEAAGYYTWNQMDFAVMAMIGELRRSARLLLTSDDVHHRLVALGRRRPRLARLIGRSYEVAPRLAPTLRTLVKENVSIRDLETMLAELTLSEDAAVDDVEAARRALAPAITHRFAPGRTLVAYLVDPDFTHAVRRNGSMADSDADAIRSAVWRELSYLPPTARRPAILTDADARGLVHRALEPELPGVVVLSYDELDPDVNIQPIARIILQ